jgi:hypothetical protein
MWFEFVQNTGSVQQSRTAVRRNGIEIDFLENSRKCLVIGIRGVLQQMIKQYGDALDALPGCPDVPPLAAVGAPLAGKTIVRWKDDAATAKDCSIIPGVAQHGPANGSMANIESQMEWLGGCGIFSCHTAEISQCASGIKTKLEAQAVS